MWTRKDEDLLNSLLLTVRNKQPVVPAMCLIAYENVFLVRTAFERIATSIPGCSPSLENLARWLEQQHSLFSSGSI